MQFIQSSYALLIVVVAVVAGGGCVSVTPGSSTSSTAADGCVHSTVVPVPGPIVKTGVETNLAINGPGYLAGRAGSLPVFTRDGSFYLDFQTGALVNTDGVVMLGARGHDAPGAEPVDLILPFELPQRATTRVELHVNLDAEASNIARDWDSTTAATAATTSSFSTSETVYDSIGGGHRVDVYFRNTGANATWDWHALVDGKDTTGGVPGTAVEIASGELSFNVNGSLNAVATAASSGNFVDAMSNQSIDFEFGSQVSLGGTGLDGSTSFAQASTVSLATQDGYAMGVVAHIQISPSGMIDATYSNGAHSQVGQVLLARFNQPTKLTALGGNRFAASDLSGPAQLDVPGTFELGLLVVGAVEEF